MAGFIDSVLSLFGMRPNSSLQLKDSGSPKKTSTEIISEVNQSNIQRIDYSTTSQNITQFDQADGNYQSITVHGHSIFDPPISRINYPKPDMTWVGNGESIQIQEFTIHNPLTYWSNKKNPDASCINVTLKIEMPKKGTLSSLPYWPQYNALTPVQRWKYLSWLSQERNTDHDEIGYAFIFFYGLERRAIIERNDVGLILDEVNRILSRYQY